MRILLEVPAPFFLFFQRVLNVGSYCSIRMYYNLSSPRASVEEVQRVAHLVEVEVAELRQVRHFVVLFTVALAEGLVQLDEHVLAAVLMQRDEAVADDLVHLGHRRGVRPERVVHLAPAT